ncbi:cation transporter [Wenzhouxiangella sp. XN201]|uniref:cation diffusion facilitator family transporter n=1 Tax=Wenzhouxiangella sp. XN201 TaxID=2710755 RepID=UPI0013CCB6EE|nr:cation diffusion facilitator family transporter [Wenzhouxiangella sp. XN201]NEZ04411.1 cation transporter [Wenzhouxiangella sp. XN201]
MNTKPASTDNDNNHWPAKRRVTVVGALWNLLLSVGKIAAGIVGQSQALVVDGVHSFSDLISDAVVLIAARWSSIDPDHNHPYGHGRIETLATAVVGLLLVGVALAFVWDAITRLLNPERLLRPGWLALAAAVASVVIKEGLYHYTRAVALRTNSRLIAANAWHHRSDAFSSLVVIVGIVGVISGLAWFDALAAIVVAGMVGWMGGQFVLQAMAELVDTGVPVREQKELGGIIQSVDGVRSYRNLRTRRMAGRIVMDVCVLLDPQIPLAEADRVAASVRRRLLDESTEVTDVVVSIAPHCDSGTSARS